MSHKYIELTNGGLAICDESDYSDLVLSSWFHVVDGNVTYAAKAVEYGRLLRMHTYLLKTRFVDHVNGNGLDNRRSNLRPATNAQNQMNRGKYKNNTSSKFKGVHWHKRDKRWIACIKANGARIQIGSFTDEVEAAEAYNKAAEIHFGEYAKTNTL